MAAMAALNLLSLSVFAALMAVAAIEDCRRLVIPNRLILCLLLLWPIHLASTGVDGLTVVEAVGGALAIFLAGALFHARGLVGGGDVKLLSAAALWAGGDQLPALLLVTGICGGILSLLLLTPLGARLGARPPTPAVSGPAPSGRSAVVVPYGAAIAGAALLVILPPVWG